MQYLKVAVLYGGKSGEREVSLASGENAAKLLAEAGFDIRKIDTAEDGFINQILEFRPDVAFIALHGKGGEDGSMQGLLELLDIPYTGSGVLSSALTMDKARSKLFYRDAGLNTADSTVIMSHDAYDRKRLIDTVGIPCVVKPVDEGSSLGVTIVADEARLDAAVKSGFEVSRRLLIERFIAGTEVTVGVLGNNEPYALPVIEIVPHGEFYDFNAKYAIGGSDHICPARISAALTARCQQYAEQAHKALGCRGVSRTDIIIDKQGQLWVIETNTIPGMTNTSLLPDAARTVGMSATDLYRSLITMALE
ncbi:MAG: D-alanine--D-alanine ligase [Coriobacteriales bacterium]|jgi:D-alanine-D-alanine ligase|nr:D-alanine--D-alanine ligase [Coriobacteriales bacterium]